MEVLVSQRMSNDENMREAQKSAEMRRTLLCRFPSSHIEPAFQISHPWLRDKASIGSLRCGLLMKLSSSRTTSWLSMSLRPCLMRRRRIIEVWVEAVSFQKTDSEMHSARWRLGSLAAVIALRSVRLG